MATNVNKPDHGAIEAKKYGIDRSPEWPGVQEEHLKLQPNCVVCAKANSNGGLQVHHIFPFHYCIALGRSDLELDDRNLITLCEKEKGHPAEDHHLLIGHLDDFKSSNLNVVNDANVTYKGMTESQIKANKAWQAEKKNKLKPLDQMTDKDKADFKALMDKTFPK